MKILSLVILCFLVGCSARPPLAELQAEAEQTGDWSAVEKYHRQNKAMNRISGENPCKNGYRLLCTKKSESEYCTCVSPLDRQIFN